VLYSIKYNKSLIKSFAKLDANIYERIKLALAKLSQNPFPQGFKKLKARDGYRIRIGDYRLIYQVDDSTKTIFILDCGHRSDIY
jgi:mRNA interferase RelE/StbE